jgi:probable F420-dependent oxidoreductase
MKFGVHLPQAGREASGRAILDIARQAEELGFDSVWLYDHLFTPEKHSVAAYPGSADGVYRFPLDAPYLDCVAVLGALAAATERVKFGTRVMVPLLRNPAVLGKQLAGIDEIAGGRMLLGLGVGWMPEEFEAAGVPFERRGARMDEHVAVMRNVWSGELKGFDGEFYRHVAGNFLPVPPRGTIPILFGGFSDAALRRVARIGDGWAVMVATEDFGDNDPADIILPALHDRLDALRRECDAVGRDFGSLTLVAEAPFTASMKLLQGYEDVGIHMCDLVSMSRPSKLADQITEFQGRVGVEI